MTPSVFPPRTAQLVLISQKAGGVQSLTEPGLTKNPKNPKKTPPQMHNTDDFPVKENSGHAGNYFPYVLFQKETFGSSKEDR